MADDKTQADQSFEQMMAEAKEFLAKTKEFREGVTNFRKEIQGRIKEYEAINERRATEDATRELIKSVDKKPANSALPDKPEGVSPQDFIKAKKAAIKACRFSGVQGTEYSECIASETKMQLQHRHPPPALSGGKGRTPGS